MAGEAGGAGEAGWAGKWERVEASFDAPSARTLLCSDSCDGFVLLEFVEDERGEYVHAAAPGEGAAGAPGALPAQAPRPPPGAVKSFVASLWPRRKPATTAAAGFRLASLGKSFSLAAVKAAPPAARRSGPRTECRRAPLDWFDREDNRHGALWLAAVGGLEPGAADDDDDDDDEEKKEEEEDGEEGGKEGKGGKEEEGEAAPRSGAARLAPRRESKSGEIDRDICRTYATLPVFQQRGTQERLGRLLEWVAAEFPDTGYVQGMNYIMAQVMAHCPEDRDARALFAGMMRDPRYDLHGMFARGLRAVQVRIEQLRAAVRATDAALFAHLEALGLDTLHFSLNWFITLFASSMPFEQLRDVWDLFFERGWPAMFAVSLVLLAHVRPAIMSAEDMQSCSDAIRAAPSQAPPDLGRRARRLALPECLPTMML